MNFENNTPGVKCVINDSRLFQPSETVTEDDNEEIKDVYGGNAFENFNNTIFGGNA